MIINKTMSYICRMVAVMIQFASMCQKDRMRKKKKKEEEEEDEEEVVILLLTVDFVIMHDTWCMNCSKATDQEQSLMILEVSIE